MTLLGPSPDLRGLTIGSPARASYAQWMPVGLARRGAPTGSVIETTLLVGNELLLCHLGPDNVAEPLRKFFRI